MIALEITFGDYRGPIEIEMTQIEISNGERKPGLNQRIDTSDYPGMLALSMSIKFKVAYEREGDYRYEFFLNGVKRAETSLRVRAVSEI